MAAGAMVEVDSRVAANGDGEAVIVNRSRVPLTAWIFEILLEPCSPAQAREGHTGGYDAETSPGGKALAPGASTIQNIGAAHCNKDGVSIPARAVFKAALFQDGSTYGDREWVEILLRQRREAENQQLPPGPPK